MLKRYTNKKRRKVIWLVVIVLLLFLLLVFNRLFSFYSLLLPIQEVFFSSATGINNKIDSLEKVKNIDEIIRENEELKEERNQMLMEISKLKIYREENKVLKEKLSFFETDLSGREYVIARVVAKDINNNSLLTLNKGSRDGVVMGAAVIVGEGNIVAKIVQTSHYSSKALLLRDSQSSLAGKILDKGDKSNLVEGKYGLSIRIELIPQDLNLQTGDIVITSGIEENIPQGLLIGKVEKIEASPNDLFKAAIVQPFVSYDNIYLVSILLPERMEDN